MTGLGKLVAQPIASGAPLRDQPFALGRYAEGRTFGAHNSNCPWV